MEVWLNKPAVLAILDPGPIYDISNNKMNRNADLMPNPPDAELMF